MDEQTNGSQEEKPKKKMSFWKVILIVFVVIIVMGMISSFFDGNNDEQSGDETVSETTTKTIDFAKNETITVGIWEFKITGFLLNDRPDSNFRYEMSMSAKNMDSSEHTFSDEVMVKCIYTSNGTEYTYNATFSWYSSFAYDTEPLMVSEAEYYFTLPYEMGNDWTTIHFEVYDYTDKQTIYRYQPIK